EEVHIPGLAGREARLDRVSQCGDLARKDQATELRFRSPFRQVPLGPCRSGLAPTTASPLRHQAASSFDFTASNCFAISSPMWAARTRSFSWHPSVRLG